MVQDRQPGTGRRHLGTVPRYIQRPAWRTSQPPPWKDGRPSGHQCPAHAYHAKCQAPASLPVPDRKGAGLGPRSHPSPLPMVNSRKNNGSPDQPRKPAGDKGVSPSQRSEPVVWAPPPLLWKGVPPHISLPGAFPGHPSPPLLQPEAVQGRVGPSCRCGRWPWPSWARLAPHALQTLAGDLARSLTPVGRSPSACRVHVAGRALLALRGLRLRRGAGRAAGSHLSPWQPSYAASGQRQAGAAGPAALQSGQLARATRQPAAALARPCRPSRRRSLAIRPPDIPDGREAPVPCLPPQGLSRTRDPQGATHSPCWGSLVMGWHKQGLWTKGGCVCHLPGPGCWLLSGRVAGAYQSHQLNKHTNPR